MSDDSGQGNLRRAAVSPFGLSLVECGIETWAQGCLWTFIAWFVTIVFVDLVAMTKKEPLARRRSSLILHS